MFAPALASVGKMTESGADKALESPAADIAPNDAVRRKSRPARVAAARSLEHDHADRSSSWRMQRLND